MPQLPLRITHPRADRHLGSSIIGSSPPVDLEPEHVLLELEAIIAVVDAEKPDTEIAPRRAPITDVHQSRQGIKGSDENREVPAGDGKYAGHRQIRTQSKQGRR